MVKRVQFCLEGLMPTEGSQLTVFDPITAKAESAWISDVL